MIWSILFITGGVFVLIAGTSWMIRNCPFRRELSDYDRGYNDGIRDAFKQGIGRGIELSQPATQRDRCRK